MNFKKFALIFVGLVLVLGFGTLGFMTFFNFSEGVRIGTIVKLAKRGYVFKTWEGELYQGFLESNPTEGGIATRSWNFSVQDKSGLLDDLNKVVMGGHKVKVDYQEKLNLLPWVGDTRYVVDSVEVVQ
ncbi:MAG: hypothetical protein EOP09_16475 [Proteobacteria bacterium]|nr:MAG: hypothetical protein EOP09_16475 [Pseudomonadota bacterium]